MTPQQMAVQQLAAQQAAAGQAAAQAGALAAAMGQGNARASSAERDLQFLKRANNEPAPDALVLTTMHSSKGLEWDHV